MIYILLFLLFVLCAFIAYMVFAILTLAKVLHEEFIVIEQKDIILDENDENDQGNV